MREPKQVFQALTGNIIESQNGLCRREVFRGFEKSQNKTINENQKQKVQMNLQWDVSEVNAGWSHLPAFI